jgi:hypothetical protein
MPDLDEECDDEDQDGDDVDEDVDHESDEEAGTSGGAFSETAQKIDRLISNQAVTSSEKRYETIVKRKWMNVSHYYNLYQQ